MKIQLILKARTGLVAKKVQVTKKGKTFTQTVWVRAGEKKEPSKFDKKKELEKKFNNTIKTLDKLANRDDWISDEAHDVFNQVMNKIGYKDKDLEEMWNEGMSYQGMAKRIYEEGTEKHMNMLIREGNRVKKLAESEEAK